MNSIINFLTQLSHVFWQNPIAQSLGLIALLIGVSAFFQKNDQRLRYFLTVFTLFMAVHFLLLEQWVGASMAFLGSFRNFVSSRTNNTYVMYIFIVLAWLLALPTIDNSIHLLPVVATTFGTVAVFKMKGIQLRLLMSLGTICWLTHNFLVFSIGGVLVEFLFLMINAHTMFSLYKQTKYQD